MSDENRIRERAHAIWEEAGRPDGADEAHWAQAEREFDAAAPLVEAPKETKTGPVKAVTSQAQDTVPASKPASRRRTPALK